MGSRGALPRAPYTRRVDTQQIVESLSYITWVLLGSVALGGVALAWLLHRPGVTAPIVGPRTMAQLQDSMPAFDVTLDADALQRLDEIWPGPGGAAPEAYAW